MAREKNLFTDNFKVFLNGTAFTEKQTSAVEAITVEDELNVPTMFTVRVNIADFSKGDWKGVDLEEFKLGDEMVISLGADDAQKLVVGEIASLEPCFGDDSHLIIRGYDRLYRLRFGTFRRSFLEMKDSDIVSQIASDIGLTPETEDTKTMHAYVFQNNQTNYDFIIERSKLIDFEVAVEDKTLYFRSSKEGVSPSLTLESGMDLESISFNLKTLTVGSEVEVRGWDVAKKEAISSIASDGSVKAKMGGADTGFGLSKRAFGSSRMAFVDMAVVDAVDAEGMAKARYNSMVKNFLSGEGRCSGNPELRAGKTVELKGLGKKFSGVYYINSSMHLYSPDKGYVTKFKVRRTAI